MPAQTPWRRPSFVLANLFTGGAMCTGTPIICFTKSFQRHRTQLLFSFRPLDNDSCKFQWVSMASREQWPFKWLPNENVIASTEQRFLNAPILLLDMKTNSKEMNLQGLFSSDSRPVAHCCPIFIWFMFNLLNWAHLISKPDSPLKLLWQLFF